MATVYEINKGINRSIEFKGIKAQYIIYLAAGLVSLLLLFAILYVCHTNIYVCLGIILSAGCALVMTVQTYSKKYGEHGLTKRAAQRKLPRCIRSYSRQFFYKLKTENEKATDSGKAPAHL